MSFTVQARYALLAAAFTLLPLASPQPHPPTEKKAMLAQKLLELSRRARLEPKEIATVLGSKLGPARQTTSVRTEYDLAATELIAVGTVSTANAWVVVSVKPAASVGLVLQDLEPHFLDCPYEMEVATSHRSDGPAIRSLDHLFLVKAGMLVVGVPPRPPTLPTHGDEVKRAYGDRWDTVVGKRTAPDPVLEIVLTSEPKPGLEKQTTLRTFREQVRKAAAGR